MKFEDSEFEKLSMDDIYELLKYFDTKQIVRWLNYKNLGLKLGELGQKCPKCPKPEYLGTPEGTQEIPLFIREKNEKCPSVPRTLISNKKVVRSRIYSGTSSRHAKHHPRKKRKYKK